MAIALTSSGFSRLGSWWPLSPFLESCQVRMPWHTGKAPGRGVPAQGQRCAGKRLLAQGWGRWTAQAWAVLAVAVLGAVLAVAVLGTLVGIPWLCRSGVPIARKAAVSVFRLTRVFYQPLPWGVWSASCSSWWARGHSAEGKFLLYYNVYLAFCWVFPVVLSVVLV